MKFRVHLVKIMGPGYVREVDIPDPMISSKSDVEINTAVMALGQNYSERQDLPSVRHGDIIEWPECDGSKRFFRIDLVGFEEITEREAEDVIGIIPGSAAVSEKMKAMARSGVDPLSALPGEDKIIVSLLVEFVMRDWGIISAFCEEHSIEDERMLDIQARLRNLIP